MNVKGQTSNCARLSKSSHVCNNVEGLVKSDVFPNYNFIDDISGIDCEGFTETLDERIFSMEHVTRKRDGDSYDFKNITKLDNENNVKSNNAGKDVSNAQHITKLDIENMARSVDDEGSTDGAMGYAINCKDDEILDSSESYEQELKDRAESIEHSPENTTSDTMFDLITDMASLINFQSCQLESLDEYKHVSIDEDFDKEFEQNFEINEDEFYQDALEDSAFILHTSREKASNIPIYDNSRLTYEDSMMLLMAYSVRHKLSGAAVSDLIELISLHCPEGTKIVKNLREFNVFLKSLENSLVRHYYCPLKNCQVYNGTEEPNNESKCGVCAHALSKDHFFIELPIYGQLQNLLSDPSFIEKLKYRFSRTHLDSNNIEDVYDGELYKRFAQKDGFLADPNNISFLGNTDGVSVIRSNGKSIWPIYLAINELHPLERFSRKNRLFAGLWFGEGKPHFPTFLRPFALSIQSLYTEGITIQAEDSKRTHKAIFLDMSVDAPARCLWLSMKQFNGYYGCGKCREPGERLNLATEETKGNRSQCHIYPFNMEKAATTGHAPARTHTTVKAQAMQATKNHEQGIAKPAVEGILGLSWGFGMPTFDVVRGTAIDYMHCVCEGVVEQHLNRWFTRTNENVAFPCFIGDISDIDKDMVSIKPTTDITRKPRKIADRKDWKASEKKAFLLFYSIPVLMKRLPREYMEHYMLLVGAIYRLLKHSISPDDLREASLYLKLYCAQITGLYGKRFQTFNCHQLLHLADNVTQLGPLWTHSCFPFEDFNGDLKDLFHGTRNIPSQIVQSISLLQKIPEIYAKTSSEEAKTLYETMMSKSYRFSSKTERIDDGIFALGFVQKVQQDADQSQELNSDIQAVMKAYGGVTGQIWMFKRCLINDVMFHSKSYQKVTVRNNCTAMVHTQLGDECVTLSSFFKVSQPCSSAQCTLEGHCSCQLKVTYFAVTKVLQPILPSNMLTIQGTDVVSHIIQVMETNRRMVVPIETIYKKLIRVDVSSGLYVCVVPNIYEKD